MKLQYLLVSDTEVINKSMGSKHKKPYPTKPIKFNLIMLMIACGGMALVLA